MRNAFIRGISNFFHSASEVFLSGLACRAPLSGPRRPRLKVAAGDRKESAVKPGSVVDSHSSGMRVAAPLKRPTRRPVCGPHTAAKAPLASLFGLAPGGVCHAVSVATRAVRSYRTISPLPAPLAQRLGGIFLLHFP
jgi:hypothetical protein